MREESVAESIAESLSESLSENYSSSFKDEDDYEDDFTEEEEEKKEGEEGNRESPQSGHLEKESTAISVHDSYSDDFEPILAPAKATPLSSLRGVTEAIPSKFASDLEQENSRLRALLNEKERALEQTRNRDLHLLTLKQARAKHRRELHQRELEETKDAVKALRKERDELEESMHRLKVLLAEAQTRQSLLSTQVEELRKANSELNQQIDEQQSDHAAAIQALKLERDMERERRLREEGEREKERERRHTAELEFIREREQLRKEEEERMRIREIEQNEFKAACLQGVKEQQLRVDRLQKTLESELCTLRSQQEKFNEDKQRLKQDFDKEIEKRAQALIEERAEWEKEKYAKGLDLERRLKECEEQRISLLHSQRNVEYQERSLQEKKAQLSVLRTCVESERDKLMAAREEMEMQRRKAKAVEEEAQKRVRAAMKQLERMECRAKELEKKNDFIQQLKEECVAKEQKLNQQLAMVNELKSEFLQAIEQENSAANHEGLLSNPNDTTTSSREEDRTSLTSFKSFATPPEQPPVLQKVDTVEALWNSDLMREMLSFSNNSR